MQINLADEAYQQQERQGKFARGDVMMEDIDSKGLSNKGSIIRSTNCPVPPIQCARQLLIN
jgi:hypothetical protein